MDNLPEPRDKTGEIVEPHPDGDNIGRNCTCVTGIEQPAPRPLNLRFLGLEPDGSRSPDASLPSESLRRIRSLAEQTSQDGNQPNDC